ncbi:hypothetical protein BJY04DRAFT_49970 [Aspergillus karnatakaensis]|uniref:uncharacterized protein n=1 Tax=Aspergillus karnatakaensis TaxID=1810916 RepID=UPI003CCDB7C3
MYGIVTSGDIIQFHKLKDNGDLLSSPVLLLSSEGSSSTCGRGIASAWSYLREIMHILQIKASLPVDVPDPDKALLYHGKWRFEIKRMLMRSRWRLTADRNPIEDAEEAGLSKIQAGREARYLHIYKRDPGDVELRGPLKDIEDEEWQIEGEDGQSESLETGVPKFITQDSSSSEPESSRRRVWCSLSCFKQ